MHLSCIFFFVRSTMNVSTVTTAPWVSVSHPNTLDSLEVNHCVQKVGFAIWTVSMSCDTSTQFLPHCCFSMNFEDPSRMTKSHSQWNVPNQCFFDVVHKFSNGNTTVPCDRNSNLVNDLVVLACWMPTRRCSTLHRCVAIFKAIIPLLILTDAHGIVADTCRIFRTAST